jgi:hypothetical protein
MIMGEGARDKSPCTYKKLPQTPSPNPVRRGDPPGRPLNRPVGAVSAPRLRKPIT